jgi:two-component system, LytTR family, response regulator LytT
MINNFKILIVDDEVLIAEFLKDELLALGYDNIELAHHKQQALLKIIEFNPQLILLDIRMKTEREGIEIADEINKSYNIPFIFITAHSDKDIVKQALATKPVGYITKPFKKIDVYAAVHLAETNSEKQTTKTRQLIIKDGTNNTLIPFNDITFIEGEGNYVTIYYDDKKQLSRQSLEGTMKDLDDERFFKLHRSFIINLNKVTSFTKKNVIIMDKSIPISRAALADFELAMKTRN